MSNRLVVFVPVSAKMRIALIVAKGSAIIGEESSDEKITVDYEGSLYGQSTIKTYADRAQHAADRHLQNYPTVARSIVPQNELLQVGWFEPEKGIILLEDTMEAVASWLGVDAIDPKELQFSRPIPPSSRSLPDELLP